MGYGVAVNDALRVASVKQMTSSSMEEEDGDSRRRRIGPRLAYGMGLLMVFIIGSAVIGITCIFKARRYNQQVDAEIDRRLQSLSGERSGANFTLARSMTQPCKPKGARTYRALCIAPGGGGGMVAPAPGGGGYPQPPGGYAPAGYGGIAMVTPAWPE